jgi:hypothetical protein
LIVIASVLIDGIQYLRRKSGVDRAVFFGIATKCWQIPSGVITLLLIAFYFEPETQGVYYTIFGILGLQSMAEAGLTSVLMHAVSHEWSRLQITSDGHLEGDQEAINRIGSLTRGGVKCLAACGLVFALVALAWGWSLFHNPDGLTISLVLVISILISTLSLVSAGLVAILEGCNQVIAVNRNRFGQVICGSVAVWAVIAAGGTLWAIPASLGMQLIWELRLIIVGYRSVIQRIFAAPAIDLDWRQEVWPLQWKLGLQGFVHQLAFTPMIPVLYSWHGPVIAGQAGMTLNTLIQLLGVSSMWMRTRAPKLGELIALGDRSSLDTLFKRTAILSTAALLALMVAFCTALIVMGEVNLTVAQKLASRFLSPAMAMWIALAMIPIHLMQCMAIYLRAHKVDPLWRITIASNIMLTLAVIVGEAKFGAIALGASMTLVYGGITLPAVFLIWRYFRRQQSPIQADGR